MESMPLAPRSSRRRRLVAIGVTLAASVVVVPTAPSSPLATVAPTGVAAAAGLGAGGEYHPVTPARIFDSRPGLAGSENDVAPLGAKPMTPTGSTFDVQLLGLGGVPANAADVLGVVVNIVVTEPTNPGYLNAYAAGANAGTAAIVNFGANQSVPNTAIVRPGANGKLTVLLNAAAGRAHVVIDVFGWFSTSASPERGARLVPVTPGRILDTRTGLNRTPAGPLAAGEFLAVPIRGVDAVDPVVADIVPNDPDVVGVVLNMAGVNDAPGNTPTHLSVIPNALPAGQAPGTANLNLSRNQVKSNMVIVPSARRTSCSTSSVTCSTANRRTPAADASCHWPRRSGCSTPAMRSSATSPSDRARPSRGASATSPRRCASVPTRWVRSRR
jgi:hypothetical protein